VKKILFVDDNASLGKFYVLMLEREGWQITHVETEAAAMNFLAENEACPYVLLDYKLADGYSDGLAEGLREKYPDTFMVMISGDPPHKDKIVSLLERGIINDFMEKPFSIDIVLDKFKSGRLSSAIGHLSPR